MTVHRHALAVLFFAATLSGPASAQPFGLEVPAGCVAAPTVDCFLAAAGEFMEPETLALRLVDMDEVDRALALVDADDIVPEVLAFAEARRGNTAAVDALLAKIGEDEFAAQVLPVLGLALADAGDREGSRAAFTAAAAVDMGDFRTQNTLLDAFLLAYAGDIDGSRALFEGLTAEEIAAINDSFLAGLMAVLIVLGDEDRARAIFEDEFRDENTMERSRALTAIAIGELFAGDTPGAMATFDDAIAVAGGDRDDILFIAEQQAAVGLYKASIDTGLLTVNEGGYNGFVTDHVERVIIAAILADQQAQAAGLLRAHASWLVPDYYTTEPEALAVLHIVGADLEGSLAVAAAIPDLTERKAVLDRALEAVVDDIYVIGAYRFPY